VLIEDHRIPNRDGRSRVAPRSDYAQTNVRVNDICPGIIDTEMMQRLTASTPKEHDAVIAQEPIGRMGTPDDIAAAVLWLCSNGAAFVVGTRWSSTEAQTA
jgi:NAD(P)-dependent dehydrogenase (short-subunit alcohol dehydrogenase family)